MSDSIDRAVALQRGTLLKAYRQKSEKIKGSSKPEYKIVSTEPAPELPLSKKFSHCRGARISTKSGSSKNLFESPSPSGSTKSPSGIQRVGSFGFSDGENPSALHDKLSKQQTKSSVHQKVWADYHNDPKAVIGMLRNTSSHKLNIPGRAADFNNEVQWRSMLRNEGR